MGRFEAKGFHLKGLKLFQCSKELAETHYGDLSAKPFFKDLVSYIISGPVCCMVWEGPGVVKSARKLIGCALSLARSPQSETRGSSGVLVCESRRREALRTSVLDSPVSCPRSSPRRLGRARAKRRNAPTHEALGPPPAP